MQSEQPQRPDAPVPQPWQPEQHAAPPYYAPIPQAMAPMANQFKNGLGTASLIFGIITLFFAPVTLIFLWTVIVGVFAFGVPAAGIPLGVYGIKRANLHVASNRGVAMAGLVLNIIGLAIAALVLVLYIAGTITGAATSA